MPKTSIMSGCKIMPSGGDNATAEERVAELSSENGRLLSELERAREAMEELRGVGGGKMAASRGENGGASSVLSGGEEEEDGEGEGGIANMAASNQRPSRKGKRESVVSEWCDADFISHVSALKMLCAATGIDDVIVCCARACEELLNVECTYVHLIGNDEQKDDFVFKETMGEIYTTANEAETERVSDMAKNMSLEALTHKGTVGRHLSAVEEKQEDHHALCCSMSSLHQVNRTDPRTIKSNLKKTEDFQSKVCMSSRRRFADTDHLLQHDEATAAGVIETTDSALIETTDSDVMRPVLHVLRLGEAFSEAEIRLFEYIAEVAGVSFEKARLLETAAVAHRQLDAYIQVTRAINHAVPNDVNGLVGNLVEVAKEMTHADMVTLWLVDHAKKEIFINRSDDGLALRLPFGVGLAGTVALDGEIINIPEAYKDERFSRDTDKVTGYRTTSVLVVPICVDYEVTGQSHKEVVAVLQAINKQGDTRDKHIPFANDDINLFQIFSQNVALVLKRASQGAAFQSAMQQPDTESAEHGILGQFADTSTFSSNSTKSVGVAVGGMNLKQPRSSMLPPRHSMLTDPNFKHPGGAPEKGSANANISSRLSTPRERRRSTWSLRESAARVVLQNRKLSSLPESDRETDGIIFDGGDGVISAQLSSTPLPASPVAKMSPTREGYAPLSPLSFTRLMSDDSPNANAFFDWTFDVLSFGKQRLGDVAFRMLHHLDLIETFSLPVDKLQRFVTTICDGYRDNPYHNVFHGLGVMHISFMCLTAGNMKNLLTDLDLLATLIAALCHDVDHTGHTNDFEKATLSPLAVTYNDRSVLESHHAAMTFRVMTEHDCSVWCNMGREETIELRACIVKAILSTDMTGHFDMLQTLGAAVDSGGYGQLFDPETPEGRHRLVDCIVHASDLSNPILPNFDVVKEWAFMICREFTDEVEQYKKQELSFPPFMDGLDDDEHAIAKLQVGFITYVVSPLWENFARLFPDISNTAENLHKNVASWKQIVDVGPSQESISKSMSKVGIAEEDDEKSLDGDSEKKTG